MCSVQKVFMNFKWDNNYWKENTAVTLFRSSRHLKSFSDLISISENLLHYHYIVSPVSLVIITKQKKYFSRKHCFEICTVQKLQKTPHGHEKLFNRLVKVFIFPSSTLINTHITHTHTSDTLILIFVLCNKGDRRDSCFFKPFHYELINEENEHRLMLANL